MVSIEGIKYSLRNLNKSRSRSILTILSIFMGIATMFIFISFGLGLYTYVDDLATSSSADKVIVQLKGSSAPGLNDAFSLTDSDLRIIDKTDGVMEVSGAYLKAAEIVKEDERRYSLAFSLDTTNTLALDLFNINIEKGRMLKNGDDGKVLLGYNYMLDNNIFKKGLKLNDKIEIQGEEVRVVGFFEAIGNPQDDSQIYFTKDFFNELYGGDNSYGMIIARVDRNNVAEVVSKIENNLRKSRNLKKGEEDFTVQSFEDMIESFSGALNVIVGFIILVALISVIVSAVNTANTMITSVLERYKEIGVLKAIGARNPEIFTIFLFESAFLGFVAGVIGIGIGFFATKIGGIILTNLGWSFLQPTYTFIFKNDIFIYCLLFAVLTGAISGVIPAINASKTNTVDALRYE